MRRSLRWGMRGLGGIVLLLGFLGLYSLYLSVTLTLPRGENRQPIRIYGAPYPLSPGLRVRQGPASKPS